MQWGKAKAVALAARCQAEDHSAAVLTRLFASATPTLIFVLPTRVSPSSVIVVRCRDERKWSRSRISPLSIRSHWEEGIPSGAHREVLMRNLALEMSLL